ncbi:STAS domain-containing protein [Kitasatospora sp. NPDC101176]|uniref:STAS domain-containing protein n=1 Tax=Kitasatospora sp. NPDC101176 TaxID=3364099 RepID=UPI00381BECBC
MTATPEPVPDVLTPEPSATLTVEVEGDLDHETCDALLTDVTTGLSARPSVTTVHLDCSAMTMCDSMGLSTLLQIRRHTDAAGLSLLIEPRPALLDRVLQLTGTTDYLLRRSPGSGSPGL